VAWSAGNATRLSGACHGSSGHWACPGPSSGRSLTAPADSSQRWQYSAVPEIPLTIHGRAVRTVFDLLGRTENDLTYSLGWALASVPALAERILSDVLGSAPGQIDAVSLQEWGPDRGYTDIEIQSDTSHVIIEAKRGWTLPTEGQLRLYAPRLAARHSALLVLAECSPAFGSRHLPAAVAGVRVVYRSWRQVVQSVRSLGEQGPHRDRRLLRELGRYLEGAMTMQDPTSNWTYCVSLSKKVPTGWRRSTVDFVVEENIYFCPYAFRGWPKRPPNYLAFRWGGHVRDVRHVESYEVVEELQELIPEIPPQGAEFLQIVHRLGPPIPLPAPLPNGAKYRATRLWVPLDLILTEPTLASAVARIPERLAVGGEPA
jgi:hypothetical protein